ncbi:glycosyltransferase family 2 protein [Geobacter sp. AOG2]|uniref:glycosyltransferase family 2 protein n=1 Tax=Geobacter sp. AOG2 TaxID=1566347 RepID=UPI001CC6B9B3|nr:glycosyltransferase [Geobacter sp. AOG2]GFE62407.1 glycosyl transferase [Geobacter sp. AOG2]
MTNPPVDIIVPVWNSPFETRACLAAILRYSPEARMIIVDNGSNRDTELMLEEFSEPLGERGLFIKSERNIGLVPAINRGLARSDGDFAVIVRPHVLVTSGWLEALRDATQDAPVGIVSPVFSGSGAPLRLSVNNRRDSSSLETFTVSFSSLLLKAEMRMQIGCFDEGLDSGEWCLTDYIRRAWSKGYRTCTTSRSQLVCGQEAVFGSDERRQTQARISRERYLEQWGVSLHYGVYFGQDTDAVTLADAVETILEGSRRGHRFTLLLHHRQAREFHRCGWNSLHTGIELVRLSMLMPQRDLVRKIGVLRETAPEMIMVRWKDDAPAAGMEMAIPFDGMAATIWGGETQHEQDAGPAGPERR